MNQPEWCTLLGQRTTKNGLPLDCQLLAGHAGDCTVNLRIGIADDGAACEADEAQLDWRNFLRWREIAPRRFWDADLDHLDQPKAICDQLEERVDREFDSRRVGDPVGNLVLLGGVGSGKTWAACSVANRVLFTQSTRMVAIVSSVDLFRRLRPEGGARAEDFIEPRLLVIDDLGIEKSSGWTEEVLFGVVDARWRNCDPTVITSNLTVAQLRETVGERVYDRLRDGALALSIGGGSRRRASISTIAGQPE